MPLCLYLIRHGETACSLTHQHTGRTEIPLAEQGEEEARQLGNAGKAPHGGHAEIEIQKAGGNGIHSKEVGS